MNYLCISDFEGTLLKTDKTISEYTIKIINEFIKNNSFIILSESSINELIEFKNKYNLNVDIASSSEGIFIIDNKEIKYELNKDDINNLIILFKDSIYTAYTNDTIYNYQERLLSIYPKEYKISDNFESSTYLNIAIDINKDNEFKSFLEANDLSYILIGKDKNRAFYNIKNKIKDKESCYEIIINYYNNKKTIGIADSYSDLSLLNKCDISVAMKNAKDELKNNTKYITDYTNNEDGLARFLNDICHF